MAIPFQETTYDSSPENEWSGQFIDPRTGVDYGTYEEDEIVDERLGMSANSIQYNMTMQKSHDSNAILKEMRGKVPHQDAMETGLISVLRNEYDMGDLQTQKNRLSVQYQENFDPKIQADIDGLNEQIAKLHKEMPPEAYYEDSKTGFVGNVTGVVYDATRALASQGAMLKDMAGEVIQEAIQGAGEGATLGLMMSAVSGPGAGLGMAVGGAAGASTRAAIESLAYTTKQGKGEIFSSIIEDQYPDEEYRPSQEIARDMANKWSKLYGPSELLGEVAMFSGAGVGKKAIERVISIAAEGGTEGLQSIIGDFAAWEARKIHAEQNGLEFNENIVDSINSKNLRRSMYEGMLVSGAFNMPGAAYDTTKYTAETVNKLRDANVLKLQEKKTAERKAKEKSDREAIRMVIDKPTIETVELEDGTTIEVVHDPNGPTPIKVTQAQPVIEPEIEKQKENNFISATGINDGQLDEALLMSEDLQATSEELVATVDMAMSERATKVYHSLREFLPVDQARGIEDLLTLRADRMGMSFDEFVEHHQLEWQVLDTDNPDNVDSASTIQFIQDGATIIKAFGSADFTSAVHEVAHIFETDLVGEDKRIANEFVGVTEGMKWDEQAKEKWARAFERYVAEGLAPSPKLKELFTKFSGWMMNVYKSITGSDIEGTISPEIKGVFDRMLWAEEDAKLGITEAKNEYMEVANDPAIDEEIQSTVVENSAEHRVAPRKDKVTERMERKAAKKARTKAEKGQVLNQIKTRIEDSYEADRRRMSAQRKAIRENNKKLAAELGKRDIKNMTAQEILTAQVNIQARIARDLFDAGDTHGYQEARATMKALLSRERQRYATQRRHTAVKEQTHKKLKSVQAKPVHGVLTSRQSEKINSFLKELKKALAGTETMAGAKKMYKKYVIDADPDVALTEVERTRNRWLEAAVQPTSANVENLIEFNKDIANIARNGEAEGPVAIVALWKSALFEEGLTDVDGMTESEYEGKRATGVYKSGSDMYKDKKTKQRWYQWREKIKLNSFGKDVILGYNNLLNIATSYSNQPFGQAPIAKALDFFRARQDAMTELRQLQERMQSAFIESYGSQSNWNRGVLGNDWNYNAQINRDARPQHLVNGKMFSKSQIRQIWMYMQNPHDTVRLFNMGITPEERKIIEFDILDDSDKAFSAKMMEIFQDPAEYEKTNAAYMKDRGTKLSRIKRYVPHRAEGLEDNLAQEKVHSQFAHEKFANEGTVGAVSIHTRSYNADKVPLKIDGDIVLFNSYQSEMTHYRNFVDVGRKAKSVIEDADFKTRVTAEYGPALYKALHESMVNTIADGRNATRSIQAVDTFLNNFVASTLGMSVSVFSKQLISVVNYWQKMSTKDFVVGSGKFLFTGNPLKKMQSMWKHDYMANRRTQIEQNVKMAQASGEYQKYLFNPTFKNWMTVNIMLGDQAAISIGGWIYKDSLKKQTNPDTGQLYTEEEAMWKVAKDSDQTQQSGATAEKSNFQNRQTDVGRIFTMYSSGPVQALRQELEAIRGVAGGRMTPKQFAKTMAIYHFLVPAMYASAASVMSGDDKEEYLNNLKVSMALGPLSSIYNVGSVAEGVMRGVFGLDVYRDAGPFQHSVDNIIEAANALIDGDFDLQTGGDAVQSLSVLMSPVLGGGLPVRQITNRIDAPDDWRTMAFGVKSQQ